MDIASICVVAPNDVKRDCVGVLEDTHCACLVISDGKDTPDASQTVIRSVLDDFKASSAITTTSAADFLTNAHNNVLQADMGTATASVLFTDGNFAVWGNVGDCRIYHFKDKLIDEITPDHSAAHALYEAGKIRYGKIARQSVRHQLYRMIGNEKNFEPEFTPPTTIKSGECFLLCTDGFWENISVRQTERALKKSKSAEDWLLRMRKIIEKEITKSKATESHDNYSAIAVKF